MALVIPGPDETLSSVAVDLLRLAGDRPQDVRFLAGEGAFEVPDALADRWLAEREPPVASPPAETPRPARTASGAGRRGRRRAAEGSPTTPDADARLGEKE